MSPHDILAEIAAAAAENGVEVNLTFTGRAAPTVIVCAPHGLPRRRERERKARAAVRRALRRRR
jgi:hypothetical protein